jgi:hypothetical protein
VVHYGKQGQHPINMAPNTKYASHGAFCSLLPRFCAEPELPFVSYTATRYSRHHDRRPSSRATLPAEDRKHSTMDQTQLLHELCDRLQRVEEALHQLVRERTVKEWYTTAEAAALLGKAEFTVREWCRLGRVHAEKRACGRGYAQEWIIAHAELLRIQNHGLLPVPKYCLNG